jgi:hypothetical protein
MTRMRRNGVDPVSFLNEHRAIRAAVLALKARIRGPEPARRDHWARLLAEDLDLLAGLLRTHFAREEAEGMFEAILEAEPDAVGPCARLRDQHRSILHHLSAILRKLDEPRQDTASVEALRRETRALLADLARHEAEEDALLVRVMQGEEVGVAD